MFYILCQPIDALSSIVDSDLTLTSITKEQMSGKRHEYMKVQILTVSQIQ